MNDIPRRSYVERWTLAERAIKDAIVAVEAVGADVRLTDAVLLLGTAFEALADYTDGIKRVRRLPSYQPWTD